MHDHVTVSDCQRHARLTLFFHWDLDFRKQEKKPSYCITESCRESVALLPP